jgi:hypothetical protein
MAHSEQCELVAMTSPMTSRLVHKLYQLEPAPGRVQIKLQRYVRQLKVAAAEDRRVLEAKFRHFALGVLHGQQCLRAQAEADWKMLADMEMARAEGARPEIRDKWEVAADKALKNKIDVESRKYVNYDDFREQNLTPGMRRILKEEFSTAALYQEVIPTEISKVAESLFLDPKMRSSPSYVEDRITAAAKQMKALLGVAFGVETPRHTVQ